MRPGKRSAVLNMKTTISLKGIKGLLCCGAIGAVLAVVIVKANNPADSQTSSSPAYTFATLAGKTGVVNTTTETVALGEWKPGSVAVDAQGNIYFTDMRGQVVCRMTQAGVITVIAGKRDEIGSADGKGSDARFRFPQGIAVDTNGVIYVADAGNDTIRRITRDGVVSTVAGKARIPGAVDGAGNDARFNYPCDIALDNSGTLYVADLYNFLIRKVTPEGSVTTLAGQAGQNEHADGSAQKAKFESPTGIAVDHSGNVYVADTLINCIRKISPDGWVTTIAGRSGYKLGQADGRGNAALFSHPFGLATDVTGNIYVADLENHSVRRIAPNGTVVTLAKFAGASGNFANGGTPTAPGCPFRIALDRAGNLYVTDIACLAIRKGTPGSAGNPSLAARQ